MCHSLGPLARGPPFIQLAFYKNTSTPPPVLWDQAQFRRGHKSPTQNSIQSSRTSDGRGQGKGTRAGAKQVISQHKPRKSARRRVLELAINLAESRGRKLGHREVREPWEGDPGIPPGQGRDARRGRVGPSAPCSLSPAAGCSWPQPRLPLRPFRAGLTPPHVPGPGPLSSSSPPTRLQVPGE